MQFYMAGTFRLFTKSHAVGQGQARLPYFRDNGRNATVESKDISIMQQEVSEPGT